uniref:Uncharacterized protein n=1 Tax=Cucumis melo TaxID=3656 RepID=A0A9I9E5U2_CUCME
MVHQYSCFVLENFHRYSIMSPSPSASFSSVTSDEIDTAQLSCKSLLELSHIQVITLEVESSNPPFSTTFKAKIQDKERILTPTDCWRTYSSVRY